MDSIEVLDYNQEYKDMKLVLRGIAHEMGNALTVMGYSMKSLGKMDSVKDNEHWCDLNSDFDYICRLYKNLSAYNNSHDLRMEEVNLDKLLASLVSSVGDEYIDEAVRIMYEGVEDAYVMGDGVKLRQVFINIIKNAYEAVRMGGLERNIAITLSDRGVEYEVKIKDSGCGIEADKLNKIFEPMYSDKENGTGLGLPVCRNIVESHKGRISVASKPGVGTEFTIELKKSNV